MRDCVAVLDGLLETLNRLQRNDGIDYDACIARSLFADYKELTEVITLAKKELQGDKPCKKKAKTIVHINMHHIKWNISHEDKKPVITIKKDGQNIYCSRAKIAGPCEIIYSPDKPLSCGARVWIETNAEIEAQDAVLYEDL